MSRVLLLLSRTSYRAEAFVAAAHRLHVDITVGSNHRQALADLTPGGSAHARRRGRRPIGRHHRAVRLGLSAGSRRGGGRRFRTSGSGSIGGPWADAPSSRGGPVRSQQSGHAAADSRQPDSRHPGSTSASFEDDAEAAAARCSLSLRSQAAGVVCQPRGDPRRHARRSSAAPGTAFGGSSRSATLSRAAATGWPKS